MELPAFKSKIVTPFVPLTFGYNYYIGKYLEKYIQSLGEKRILGIKCGGCERVIVPPRSTCGKCNLTMEEWVEVGPEGMVVNYTIAYVKIVNGEIKDLSEPAIIAMIRLDGADSLIDCTIKGITPDKIKPGIRVKAVWKDEMKGRVTDLDHFEPV
ncbi:MAG: Zn-ribbon domain-containing OB-fold protein [bacterium]